MQRSTFNVLTFSAALALALACASQRPAGPLSEVEQLRAENSLLRRQLKAAEEDASVCLDHLKDCESSHESE